MANLLLDARTKLRRIADGQLDWGVWDHEATALEAELVRLELVEKAARAFIETMSTRYSYTLSREVPGGFSSDSSNAAIALFDALGGSPEWRSGHP